MTAGASDAQTPTLIDCVSYHEALKEFHWGALWELFSGDRDRLNIAAECLDRHRGKGIGLRLYRDKVGPQELMFDELADWSSRFANYLEERGVESGENVAVMLEPSLAFYAALFGAIKRGAVGVPLYTLFGPEAVRLRLDDCGARILVVPEGREDVASELTATDVIVMDDRFLEELTNFSTTYNANTRPDDPAVLQYTSGTSRQIPGAVTHSHRAIVTVSLAAIFAIGLKPGDRYFCPSSPAWGHGLWHGTIAPWALGISAGAYAGRFETEELTRALRAFEISNFAAAGTVYRMLLRDGLLAKLPQFAKASYTGEFIDTQTIEALQTQLRVPMCGMYGTTETGVVIGNFPGFEDYEVRLGALGKPLPGWGIAVLDENDAPIEDGRVGEISVRRRDAWFRAKDLGKIDDDGYFWYLGRADDIIISAGWTISPIEVEDVLATHPDVDEVAIVGIPDATRGQILKAVVVSSRKDEALSNELQQLVRTRLSHHEYPRVIEFADSLPKTTNGKINRHELRALHPALLTSSAPSTESHE